MHESNTNADELKEISLVGHKFTLCKCELTG